MMKTCQNKFDLTENSKACLLFVVGYGFDLLDFIFHNVICSQLLYYLLQLTVLTVLFYIFQTRFLFFAACSQPSYHIRTYHQIRGQGIVNTFGNDRQRHMSYILKFIVSISPHLTVCILDCILVCILDYWLINLFCNADISRQYQLTLTD